MIQNDRQREITVEAASKLREKLESMSASQEGVHPIIWEAQRASLAQVIEELQEEVRVYDESQCVVSNRSPEM